MMELYPKPVDFDESWDNLRECTRRLIAGEFYVTKNDWNNRISYLLPFLSQRHRLSLINPARCLCLRIVQLLTTRNHNTALGLVQRIEAWTLLGSIRLNGVKNVILIVGNTDMSQATRLSSVQPIDFEYHSRAQAACYRCVGYVKVAAHFSVMYGC